MKQRILTLVLGLWALVWTGKSAVYADDATTQPAEAVNRFGLDLYGRLAKTDGNVFFSPYSVDTALMMTLAGARGQTAAEMGAALHVTAGGDVQAEFGKLIASLQSNPDDAAYQLRVASAIWGQKEVVWVPDFLSLIQKDYLARVEGLDFGGDPEAARKTINDWVTDKTAGKITDLIPQGAVGKDTRMVLTNAVYLKDDWALRFDAFGTHDGDFQIGGGAAPVKASMMHKTAGFGYFENDQLKALQMEYTGGHLAMLVVLPKKADGLKDLESSLDGKMLGDISAGLDQTRVDVAIPKFKFSQQFDLGAALQEMGIKQAFTDHADFSGMDGAYDLRITGVVHKAYVAVDERGTEAAAATGIVVGATAFIEPQAEFHADHPFLFLIRDLRSGAILFMGRVSDPGKG